MQIPTTPEDTIRSLVAEAIAPATLPPTRRFHIRYVRGTNDQDGVAFAPELLSCWTQA
jgi:hypothetical protein